MDAFIRQIRELPVHGFAVYEDGRLTQAWGTTTGERFPIYSATKTLTSLAVGLAIDEGKLALDRSILDYLPDGLALPPEQEAAWRGITVKRLLTMSVAGFPFRPEGESWLYNALRYPLPHPEREVFAYSNAPAYLVGVAASNALGEDLYGYLQRRLLQPLGIADPPCQRCPDGYFYGATGMSLTVQELGRIGRLLCDGGRWEGRQLVPENYIREATRRQIGNRDGGYGYFLWIRPDGYYISGKWGQKCYVQPEKKRVVTVMAHMEENERRLTRLVERYLLFE